MEKQNFLKNAQAGWKNVRRESQRHILEGVTQFEYLSDVGAQVIGEARKVLYNFLDKWDSEDSTNPNFEEAVKREVASALWKTWYNRNST